MYEFRSKSGSRFMIGLPWKYVPYLEELSQWVYDNYDDTASLDENLRRFFAKAEELWLSGKKRPHPISWAKALVYDWLESEDDEDDNEEDDTEDVEFVTMTYEEWKRMLSGEYELAVDASEDEIVLIHMPYEEWQKIQWEEERGMPWTDDKRITMNWQKKRNSWGSQYHLRDFRDPPNAKEPENNEDDVDEVGEEEEEQSPPEFEYIETPDVSRDQEWPEPVDEDGRPLFRAFRDDLGG
ncbi:MAG: hypothetical protein ACTSVD_04250 [Candidatus Thorarchaeota archaeon]|nr:MAG: hypothetical protein DRO93_07850 [Candidatus Thorarchaeota archaeon]